MPKPKLVSLIVDGEEAQYKLVRSKRKETAILARDVVTQSEGTSLFFYVKFIISICGLISALFLAFGLYSGAISINDIITGFK